MKDVKIEPGKMLLLFSLAMIATSIVYVCNALGTELLDVKNFYQHGLNVLQGTVPYRDYVFEFPPLSLVFMTIPAVFTSDMNVYAAIFAAMVVAAEIATLYCIIRIAERFTDDRNLLFLIGLVFTVFVLIYGAHLVQKIDMFAVVATVMAIRCRLEGRKTAGYILLTVGALIKIYPALMMTAMFLIDVVRREISGRDAIRIIGSCAAVCIIAVAPFLLVGTSIDQLMSMVSFHGDRGFQTESTVAAIMLALNQLGLMDITIVSSNYTFDVHGPLADLLLPIWNYVFAAAVLISLAFIAYVAYRDRGASGSMDMIMHSSIVVMLVFLLFNKVFSTQYIAWIMPILALALLFIDGERMNLHLALCMVVSAGTVIAFIGGASGFGLPFVVILWIRDIALIALLYLSARHLLASVTAVRA